MREDTLVTHRIGLTPLLVRLAWSFAKRGVGHYYIEHKDYDNVLVSELYGWRVVESEGSAGTRVEFRRKNTSLRYVEFGTQLIGGGGIPIISKVPSI
ncbi:hypothetical protein CMI47_20145 [Candidatus Pacearchaeota archaeon]|nr:hypothetical protein [Candidatus Pacearchaeota archaeon]|tara:strand:- start:3838 stop:4128 length:291 start_codon:yes stop_codon:yes gene_type:complete